MYYNIFFKEIDSSHHKIRFSYKHFPYKDHFFSQLYKNCYMVVHIFYIYSIQSFSFPI